MSRPLHLESPPAGSANADNPPLRFVTAAALFDGHDAAINVMRRLIQAQGAEVVHLGHNRSVADIVRAALQENADAIAVSSYPGGHSEFFRYMVDMLRERGAGHIRIFGGGGGTMASRKSKSLKYKSYCRSVGYGPLARDHACSLDSWARSCRPAAAPSHWPRCW